MLMPFMLLSSANIKKADSLERSLKLPILHFNSNPTMDPSTKWGWNRVNISRTDSRTKSKPRELTERKNEFRRKTCLERPP